MVYEAGPNNVNIITFFIITFYPILGNRPASTPILLTLHHPPCWWMGFNMTVISAVYTGNAHPTGSCFVRQYHSARVTTKQCQCNELSLL